MRIVPLFWGDPAGYVEQVKDANGVVLQTVGSAEEARRAAASGVDVVVAQGWEAGGHVGVRSRRFPRCARRGRGGTGASDRGRRDRGRSRSGRRARAGCSSGVAGYPVLLAQEMPIHEEYRGRLMDAAETDAQWYANLYEVGWPDAHRGRCEGRVQAPRPASLTVATSLGGAVPGRGSMVPLRRVPTLTCVSPRTAGDGHPHSTSPPFPRSQRGAARPLGPAMLRAAVVSTMRLRRFG